MPIAAIRPSAGLVTDILIFSRAENARYCMPAGLESGGPGPRSVHTAQNPCVVRRRARTAGRLECSSWAANSADPRWETQNDRSRDFDPDGARCIPRLGRGAVPGVRFPARGLEYPAEEQEGFQLLRGERLRNRF